MTVHKKEDFAPLSHVRVLQPFQKVEHNLLWPGRKVKLCGFFGLPAGIVIERVKIGAFSFEEMGAVGKVVFPGQPCVVVLENMTALPLSLKEARCVFEDLGENAPTPERKREELPEPGSKAGRTLLRYDALVFGGGEARVSFRVKEPCTFEEVWTLGCDLVRVDLARTCFQGPSLGAYQGVHMTAGTFVELFFSPKAGRSKARAVVRLEKAVFPPAPNQGGFR